MEEQHLTAYHEAGHIVCAHALGLEIGWVSIEPDEDTLGRAHTPLRDDIAEVWQFSNDQADDEYLENHLVCYMAGAKAEEILTGNETGLEGTDLEGAMDFVLHLAGSEEKRQLELSSRVTDRAESLLRANWHIVERLSEELLKHRTLDAVRVMETVRGTSNA